MTTASTPEAIDLMTLAERMGIPADEAMRQVAQLVADVDRRVVARPTPEPVASGSLA